MASPKFSFPGPFSIVDNPGRSVPTATSRVECTTRKACYRWSNVLATRAYTDDLNPTPLNLFTFSSPEESEV